MEEALLVAAGVLVDRRDLVFVDRDFHAAGSEQVTGAARGVRLVGAEPIRGRARTAGAVSFDSEMLEQSRQHRVVVGLARPDKDNQREPPAVDEVMDLGSQTAS